MGGGTPSHCSFEVGFKTSILRPHVGLGPTMANRLEERISWRSAAVAKSGKSLFTIPHSHSRYCCAHRAKTTSRTVIRCSKFGCGVRLRGGRILAKPVRLHDRVPAPRLPLAPQQHLAHHGERTLDLSLIRSSPFASSKRYTARHRKRCNRALFRPHVHGNAVSCRCSFIRCPAVSGVSTAVSGADVRNSI